MLGHDYEHELFELIRVFFPDKEIYFQEKEEEINVEGFFIYSSLVKHMDTTLVITRVYFNDSLIKENLVDVDSISIENLTKDVIIKNALKKSIYDSLIDLIDFEIPWGILTGIRPIKIAHNLISAGLDDLGIKNILINEYRIHEIKAKLMMDVAYTQRNHLYPIDDDKYSLYISIPFCPSRCSYCSFTSFSIGKQGQRVSGYVDTLIYEIKKIKEIMEYKSLNTVYIGGGTPTAIKISELERIIAMVMDSFKDIDIKEFTVEAGRPDTLSYDMLGMLRFMGIDRISINPQTMNPKTLETIGRNHDVESIVSTYYLARELGFKTINMDIILGLPGEGIGEIDNTINRIRELDPDNITVHALAIKKGSNIINHKDDILKESKVISDMFDLTELKIKAMGMYPYYLYRQKQIIGNLENIGYCKPNKECIYNISMMEEKETIIGAGLGAVSKFYKTKENRIVRVPNFKDLDEYSSRIDELIDKKKKNVTV